MWDKQLERLKFTLFLCESMDLLESGLLGTEPERDPTSSTGVPESPLVNSIPESSDGKYTYSYES